MSGVYSVARLRGCVVITGAVPVDEFCALVGVWQRLEEHGKEWIVDARLASSVGANFVIGPKAACMAWRVELGLE
jgi:hypothetical protein